MVITAADEKQRRLDQLYRDHASRLQAFARGLLRDHDVAFDAVQTVFARLIEVEIPSENERGWLFQVVRNECLAIRRRQKVDERARQSIGQSLQATAADREVDHSGLTQAIKHLSEGEQLVLRYRLFDELSFQAISEQTGESVTALTSRFSRAISKLRQKLTP